MILKSICFSLTFHNLKLQYLFLLSAQKKKEKKVYRYTFLLFLYLPLEGSTKHTLYKKLLIVKAVSILPSTPD